VFRKLCRTARSSGMHKTESVSVMGRARTVGGSVFHRVGPDSEAWPFFVVLERGTASLPDHHVLPNAAVSVIRFWCHLTLTFDLEMARMGLCFSRT